MLAITQALEKETLLTMKVPSLAVICAFHLTLSDCFRAVLLVRQARQVLRGISIGHYISSTRQWT